MRARTRARALSRVTPAMAKRRALARPGFTRSSSLSAGRTASRIGSSSSDAASKIGSASSVAASTNETSSGASSGGPGRRSRKR